jgi:hypothetical protein
VIKYSAFVTGTFAALCIAAGASAQTASGFAIDRFQPSERGSEWFVTDSLDLRGRGRMALGFVADWAHRPLVIYDANGDAVRAPISSQLYFHLGGAVIAADRLRLAFNLPVLADNRGESGRVGGFCIRTVPARRSGICAWAPTCDF